MKISALNIVIHESGPEAI